MLAQTMRRPPGGDRPGRARRCKTLNWPPRSRADSEALEPIIATSSECVQRSRAGVERPTLPRGDRGEQPPRRTAKAARFDNAPHPASLRTERVCIFCLHWRDGFAILCGTFTGR